LIKDHKAIVAALARGDAATASKRLERHFDESERLLIESLEPTPLPSAQVSSAEA
jgi:DNA-binding GntR family transcriptional regulator